MLIKQDNLIPDKLPKLTANIGLCLDIRETYEALAEMFGRAENLKTKPYKYESYKLLQSGVKFEDEGDENKIWSGAKPICDLCQRDLSDEGAFVNGRLLGSRQWGLMCLSCFSDEGAGFGEGNGQLYLLNFSDDWILVARS